MRSISKIWLLVFAVMLLSRSMWAADFTASLDRDTITLGENATLSLTFEGGQPNSVPVPTVSGLQFGRPIPNVSQNIDFNSGQINSIISLAYPVTAQQAGDFVIPAFTANIGGQSFTTQPLKLTVQKPVATTAADAAAAATQFAFMKLVLPKVNIYLGETIVASLQIYYRSDTEIIRQPQVTRMPAEGFSVGKIVAGEQRQVQIGNATFNVLPAEVPLTATKTGVANVGPFGLNLALSVPSNGDGGGDEQERILRQLGIQMQSREGKQFSLASEILTAQLLPLPVKNRPVNFTGAVGNYTMTATVGPTNLPAGDPITLRVQISGHGALDTVMLPDQSNMNGFKIFPPTIKTELSDQLGLEGTKTFEEIVTPQNASVHELPAFAFSFFNPDDGRYHTLTQAAVPLVVRAAGATPLPTIAVAKNYAADNSQSPTDISPIKNDLGMLTAASAPLIGSPKFLVLQSVPVLAFLAALIWRKRADNLANNPRLRRKIYVAQLMQTGLSDLKKSAAANNPDEFFATLFRLLQEQLGERLDCPASAITESVIEEHPVLRGAAATTRSGLHEIFQLCNQARYAPVRGVSELNSVAQQFEKVIGELQNLKA